MPTRMPFIGGNWKMNTNRRSAVELASNVVERCRRHSGRADVAIYPPSCYFDAVRHRIEDSTPVMLGAQNVWCAGSGAFTGEISTDMLRDFDITTVLVGHSERRHVVGESEQCINEKVKSVLGAGMLCVLCIGETKDQRETGETDHINRMQLESALDGVKTEQATAQLVIAYEPVWAIGTGLTASPDDAQAAHEFIRQRLATRFDEDAARSIRVIYGGSVKPDNADELVAQADIDGFLVGGSSLRADDFAAIVESAASA